MKIFYMIGIILLMSVLSQVYSQQNKLIYDQLIKPPNADFYHIPVGLCEDYPEETTNLEIIRNDFEFLKKHGVNLLRISFGWDAIEEQKDRYNWLFWDDYVRIAVEEYGITLIPYICYTPRWNSRGINDIENFWNYPPSNFEQFGLFMTQIVNRYKTWIKTWELWNEPDISVYWRGTSQEYAELVKIGSNVVRQADPAAKVVLGGIAHRPEFLRELFRDHGISPYVDIVNMHNYFETWNPQHLENIVHYVNEVAGVVASFGDNQALWMAEVGYSTWRVGSKVSDHYTAYYRYEHTPEYQAVDLIKRLALVMSTGNLSAITWYELKDLPPSDDVIGDNNNRNLGVAYVDYRPKPAAKALRFFNKLFQQRFRSLGDIRVKKKATSESHVIGFENEDGGVIVLAWLQTSFTYPYKRAEKISGTAQDKRQENIDIILPVMLKGKATLFNELGEQTEYKSFKEINQQTVLEKVKLVGGEIFILKIDKK